MNANSPNLHPIDGVDDLGEAVLQGLARPIGYKQSPTVVRTLIAGLATFGAGPVLAWQTKFRQYATLEQQQLWHLADWIRRSGREAEGRELLRAAEDVRPPRLMQWLIFLCVGLVAWVFYTMLHRYPIHSLSALLDLTYRHPHRYRWATITDRREIYGPWVVGISAAYLLHWIQVHAYNASVRRFIGAFNDVIAKNKMERVHAAYMALGLRPLWIVGAVICLPLGAAWGVFMMLAGSAQRRLIRRNSTFQRAQLATRLRTLMLTARPNAQVPMPIHLRPTCANDLCKAALSPTAQFCPRCGQRVGTPVHYVA